VSPELASPSLSPDPSPTASPSATPAPGGVRIDHFWIDEAARDGSIASAGVLDDPRIGLTRFVVYRIRFRVVNDGDTAASVVPRLLVGSGAHPSAWQAVPAAGKTAPGDPFYAASDEGATWRVRTRAIDARGLRLGAAPGTGLVPADGQFSAGRNPAPAVVLPPQSFTEVEFAIRATGDAPWETSFAFRLDPGVRNLTGRVDASVALGAAPPVELSPGQRRGRPVGDPLPAYALDPAAGLVFARLASAEVPAGPAGSALGAAGPFTSPHSTNDLISDSCAACHASHEAKGQWLVQTPSSPIATLCLRCHDGTGAVANVKAQLTAASLPANDPSTASWYSHPALATSTHTSDGDPEFAGALNRHSECTDCHQPHLSDATLSKPVAGGWTAGGAIKGASSVAVTNGAANTVPTFTWQRTTTAEYQLCFKCHSGYTTLPAQQAGSPSRWALDKAVEFNPANLSYHPVEAAGKNQTSTMAGSLSGTAPGKLWTFTTSGLVRCQNCHGPSSATTPTADAQLDNHASANRGILLRNYRDRSLHIGNEPYAATDFALCYLCHAEAPMVDTSGNSRTDTAFRFHGYHLTIMGGIGSSTDRSIDVDGAGSGNAVCAECHFRIHGSSYPVDGQAPAKALVNFAPNIQPVGGQIRWVQKTSTQAGSCTLRCHGKDHGETY
jgi:predicted CXXCH cytochrome family protein